MTDYFEELYDIVEGFFDYDHDKIKLWFETPNPQIGGLTPLEMMVNRPKKCYEIFKRNYDMNIE